MTWCALSFVLGIGVGWRAAAYRIAQRQSRRRDLAAELRSAVDLEPSEFSAFWQERA